VEVDSLVEVAGGAKATSTLASDLVLSFFGFLFFSNKNAWPNLAEMEFFLTVPGFCPVRARGRSLDLVQNFWEACKPQGGEFFARTTRT
jgi:hypothetical protein